MPAALVTGAAGFIGRALCQSLLQAGWQVWGLDALLSPSSHEGLPSLQALSQAYPQHFYWQHLDLLDLASWQPAQKLPSLDCVFHLAGLPGVRESWQHPAAYHRANVLASQALLDWCLTQQVPSLVLASSSSVYGDNPQQPWRETQLCCPVSPYALSKLEAENLFQQQRQTLRVACLRLFTVYGPGQRPDMAFRRFMQAMVTGQPLPVHAPEQMQRDFTYLSDVLQGLHLAASWLADMPSGHFARFNLGSGQSWDLKQVLAYLAQWQGQPLKLDIYPAARGEVLRTFADIGLAASVLGYSPRVNLEAGLWQMWQGFLQNLNHEVTPCPTDSISTGKAI